MPKAILLLFLLLPVLMFAQRDTVMLRHTLSVAPLRLIDNSNPGVEFGYEYRHHAFRNTRVIAAYMTPAFSNMDRWSEFRGFRLGVEELFHTRSLPRGHYIGTGLVFNNVHFRRSGFYAIDTDENTKHDTVRLDRTTIALNLFYCNQFAAGRFMFDFSSGIGLKYRILKQDKPGWPVSYARDIGAFTSLYTGGRNWAINLPFSFRLGYRF